MKNMQLAALLLLTLIAACKKETLQDPDDPTTPMVQRFLVGFTYQGADINPEKIEYDAKGRVVLCDEGDDISKLSYSGNQVQIIETRRTENNREVFNATGKLDSQGRIVELNGISAYLLPARPITYTFEYNNEGYMSRKIQNYNNGASVYEFRYSYKDGNLTAFEAYLNGVYDYGGAWEYDPNTRDRSGLGSGQFFPYNTFSGKTNKNLAVKYTGLRDGKVSWFADYAYTFDTQGYPLTKAVNISNGTAYTAIYQYK